MEGLTSGGQSSGQTDGGTTNRVIKAILQDLQFNADGIMFFGTSNDIDGIPDPLVDRLDVWFVDLPTRRERREIWMIHITKSKRDPAKLGIDLEALALQSEGYSGRQIEQAWMAAMTRAFNLKREPQHEDCAVVLDGMVATSRLMSDKVAARRERLKGRARPASIADTTTTSMLPTASSRSLITE